MKLCGRGCDCSEAEDLQVTYGECLSVQLGGEDVGLFFSAPELGRPESGFLDIYEGGSACDTDEMTLARSFRVYNFGQ